MSETDRRPLRTPRARWIAAALLAWPVGAALAQPQGVRIGGRIGDHSTQDQCADMTYAGDSGVVLYVSASATGDGSGGCWQNAFTTLTAAFDAAQANPHVSEIWVARGVYTPTDSPDERDASFELVNGVRVYGGFSGIESRRSDRDPDPVTNGTVLSGDTLGDDDGAMQTRSDNVRHVVRADGVDASTVLNGFAILGGQADGDDGTDGRSGGGLYVADADVRIRSCVFFDNFAAEQGGGAYVQAGAPLFVGCVFGLNRAADGAGLANGSMADARVETTDFLSNTATGAGGGAANLAAARPNFVSCRFLGNEAYLGGAVCNLGTSSPRFVNGLFSGNVATIGGGAVNADAAQATYVNCVLSFNAGIAAGGGMASGMNTLTVLRNAIVWGNLDGTGDIEGAQILRENAATQTYVDYSCVEGWSGALGGQGNHGLDPSFVDPSGADGVFGTLDDDLRLAGVSPCIDAGANTLVAPGLFTVLGAAGPVDLDGLRRFVDDPLTPDTGAGAPPVIDMGPYEFDRYPPPPG